MQESMNIMNKESSCSLVFSINCLTTKQRLIMSTHPWPFQKPNWESGSGPSAITCMQTIMIIKLKRSLSQLTIILENCTTINALQPIWILFHLTLTPFTAASASVDTCTCVHACVHAHTHACTQAN